MNPAHQTPFSSDTEHELIKSAVAIGSIVEMAGWATADLARRIASAGKPVAQLTVAELLTLCSETDRDRRPGGAPC